MDATRLPALAHWRCNKTALESLDISALKALKELECTETPLLKSIKANGAEALEKLDCWQTGISTIDVSELKHLTSLSCGGCEQLKELVVKGADALEALTCSEPDRNRYP